MKPEPTITVVKASDYIGRISPMIEAHHAECEAHIPRALDVCVMAYKQAEAFGKHFAVVAEINEQVVGYCGGFLSLHPHYATLYVFNSDVMYVAPEYRSHALTYHLMHTAEAEARRRGAEVAIWHAKPNSNFAKLLGRERRLEDLAFVKDL